MSELTFTRKTLKDWLLLEEIREQILEAAGNVPQLVRDYISAASGIEYKPGAWFEDVENFENAVKVNLPTLKFALLKSREKNEKLPWEYEGRTWFYWLHLFSKAYGWSKQYIANLDIDTAIGLLQELLIEEQLEHEWEWSLSEIAYPYDAKSKTAKFRELPRPDWMKKIAPPPKKVMIRKDMLPVGNVIGG